LREVGLQLLVYVNSDPEFSSTSRDELDVFTDPRIARAPAVGG
jgi:hypothetical protein